MKRFLLPLIISTVLAACSDPKIDTSSNEAFKQSIAAIEKSLSDEKRAQFQGDLKSLLLQGIDIGAIFRGEASSPDELAAKAMKPFEGKTASEISAEAARVREERAQRERDQAVTEISELKAKQVKAEADKAALHAFIVERSRFYKTQDKYSFRPKPIIELKVKNSTSHAVSRAYFTGTISSPGRSIPWLKDAFNYEISGGLEAGEAAEWSLAPNMFSDWGKVEAPADAVFTVEVTRLDGADGEPLFDTGGWSDAQQARLDKLSEQYR